MNLKDLSIIIFDTMINKEKEKEFHDNWAKSVSLSDINFKETNECSTSPELRKINKVLNNVKNLNILDVGCGLGEFSVYMASKGANVCALDISIKMCNKTKSLALLHDLRVETIVIDSDNIKLDPSKENFFDVIYVENTLHHVDIESTLNKLLKYLSLKGTFISWDPLKYNPLINIYRKMASKVRTDDEHPFSRADIKKITDKFLNNRVFYFWLTTLIIFILMYLIDKKHPSDYRYWKEIVRENKRWAKTYLKLEKLDKFFLKIPYLKYLCWNVLIISSNKK